MEIKIGKIYINKTWRFLTPCLNIYGENFIQKFNSIFKLAVGVQDEYDKNKIEHCLYVLINKDYQPKSFQNFLSWFKLQDYYVKDYIYDADINNYHRHMIVLKIPKEFKNSYNYFLKGQYSKMYSNVFVNKVFKNNKSRENEYEILIKSKKALKQYKNTIFVEFNIKKIEKKPKEYCMPPERKKEIFNYSGKDTHF